MVDAGDWTGPGGAAAILRRNDVDVAVLETARGGLVLRGMGYESNEASVFTNVSADHLDLQGIHTLPELAEVKATVCRVTKPGGLVVLNADDPLVAGVARRVHARVAYFSLNPGPSPVLARHRRAGGLAWVLDRGRLVEWDGTVTHALLDVGRPARRPGWPGAPQRGQRPGGGRRGARAGRDARAGGRRPARLPPVGRAVAGPAQPVPARPPDDHRGLRAQRGRHGGDPRRRDGDRRRARLEMPHP